MQSSTFDPERLAFEDWADERWGREAYRHKSDTSGEWTAWQAAAARHERRFAAKDTQRRAEYDDLRQMANDMARNHLIQLDAALAAERAQIRARLLEMNDAVRGHHNYYAHAALVLFGA